MAIYYVSKGGNDANAGTGPAPGEAWLTIGKAVATVAAGDTTYIGPGTYRERVTLATAGGAATPITWQGDPDCQYLTSDVKGRVRVTGCGTNELPTVGTVWNFNAKDYNTVRDLWIDGASDSYAVTAGAGTGRVCERVRVHGCRGGITGGTNKFCAVVTGSAGNIGINAGTNTCCIVLIGGDSGYDAYSGGTSTNCIALAGGMSYGFKSATTVNCLAYGNGFCFGTHTNPLALGCRYGFYGNSTDMTLTNPVAVACYVGFFGSDPANKLVTTTAKAVWCYTNANADVSAAVASAAAILWDLLPLLSALEPVVVGVLQNGGTNTGAPSVDILGRVRPMGSGTTDVGPWELSTVTPTWTVGEYETSPPALKIARKGMQLLDVPAVAGQAISVAVRCRHVNTAGDKPQLIIGRIGSDGTFTAIATATATTSTDWQTLRVSATPAVGELLQARLYARDTGAAAYTLFSDPLVG
jgi:hypothetical protein